MLLIAFFEARTLVILIRILHETCGCVLHGSIWMLAAVNGRQSTIIFHSDALVLVLGLKSNIALVVLLDLKVVLIVEVRHAGAQETVGVREINAGLKFVIGGFKSVWIVLSLIT